ncbi:hypothetical protein [Sedimenticola selenatireducens]|uniref:Uncharacterized protein n=1 Tax=Sedimenticola selenatireducens TaxID=191960 RepID=A0A558E0Z5_9GAMM|nr:hypothetical protein [Sedimenticola selenatireducens]TVO75121.1 hypothetical protein FHP88_08900 [Sedimenticola selenatireducens]TVT67024.1 MAG: hypothetical protein FHK78_01455 [Sedimenticola selenatireducens]
MESHSRESRSRLIGRFIENWLQGVVDNQLSYADQVRSVYFAYFPDPRDRKIRFPSTGDAFHDLRETKQIVMRRLRGEIKFECDFEECAVDALPPEPRAALLRKLSARYGLMAVPVPGSVAPGVAADLARFAREFGEAITAYGELLGDSGVIDEHDNPAKLRKALNETDDVLAAASVFREAVLDALRKQDKKRPLNVVRGR